MNSTHSHASGQAPLFLYFYDQQTRWSEVAKTDPQSAVKIEQAMLQQISLESPNASRTEVKQAIDSALVDRIAHGHETPSEEAEHAFSDLVHLGIYSIYEATRPPRSEPQPISGSWLMVLSQDRHGKPAVRHAYKPQATQTLSRDEMLEWVSEVAPVAPTTQRNAKKYAA